VFDELPAFNRDADRHRIEKEHTGHSSTAFRPGAIRFERKEAAWGRLDTWPNVFAAAKGKRNMSNFHTLLPNT
jgi:hypothetical protein